MSRSLDHLDDRALVKLALENKQEAYTRLLVRHKDRVQAFISKLIVNSSEAEDLVLMSFDKAFSNLAHYNPKFAFSTWPYSIVQNLCIDYYRKTSCYMLLWKKHRMQKKSIPKMCLLQNSKGRP